MKIIALASSAVALPCLHFLHHAGMLSALVCPAREDKEVKELGFWAASVNVNSLRVLETNLPAELKSLITSLRADLVITCTFPYRVPTALLDLPARGFINIHFSKLPAYRGPSPVFWQIRNGESTTGISIQKMDEGWDTGEVLHMLEVPIFPGETIGLCTARLSQLAAGLLKQLIQSDLSPIKFLPNSNQSYYPKPGATDMCIDWNAQSAQEVENLVNACNPYGEGAMASLNRQPVWILEVSPADSDQPWMESPGTIVHASVNEGLFVGCADGKALRINIIKTREGVMSGSKLVALGIRQGMRLEYAKQYMTVTH